MAGRSSGGRGGEDRSSARRARNRARARTDAGAARTAHAARARDLRAAVAAADLRWTRMQARGRARWLVEATLERFVAFSGMFLVGYFLVDVIVAWLVDSPLAFRWSWLLGPATLVLPTQHPGEPAAWILPATILTLACTSARAHWRAAEHGAALRRPAGLPLDAATKARRLAALGVTLPAAVGP